MSAVLSGVLAVLDTMRTRVHNTRLDTQFAAENGKQISAEQCRNVGGSLGLGVLSLHRIQHQDVSTFLL